MCALRSRRVPRSLRSQPQAAATVTPPSPVSSLKPVPRQSGQLGSMSASVQVAAELLALLGAVQLLQRLSLDLADALAGEVEHLPDLLERLGLGPVQAEAQAQDALLLLVQLAQGLAQQTLQAVLEEDEVRGGDGLLLQLVGQ